MQVTEWALAKRQRRVSGSTAGCSHLSPSGGTLANMDGMHLGTPTILRPRKVGDLEGTFFVRDYQRGYRWGEDEVRRLLDDIKEAGTSEYYLQPVVVKPMEDGRWELVDGQQRLTTLYLVLQTIKDYLPQSELRYTLAYETRPGSGMYLDDPQAAASLENIDYFHMHQAFTVVQAWFGEQQNATLAAIDLYKALTSTVYVIWYEAPQEPEFDSRAMFTRLNVDGSLSRTPSSLRHRCSRASSASTKPRRSGTVSSAICGHRRSGHSPPAPRPAAPHELNCCSTPSRTQSPVSGPSTAPSSKRSRRSGPTSRPTPRRCGTR